MSDVPEPRCPDPRIAVHMPVRISTIDPEIDPHDGKPYFRTSDETFANVSRSGAFVPTEEPVATGRRLLVEIDIPDGQRIQAVGRVVWSRRPAPAAERGDATPAQGPVRRSGIGIQFLTASSRQLDRLRAFVEERLAERPAAEPGRPRKRRRSDLPPSATA